MLGRTFTSGPVPIYVHLLFYNIVLQINKIRDLTFLRFQFSFPISQAC